MKTRLYQDICIPSIGEKLVAKREFDNTKDKQAVKVVKGDEMVSHLYGVLLRTKINLKKEVTYLEK